MTTQESTSRSWRRLGVARRRIDVLDNVFPNYEWEQGISIPEYLDARHENVAPAALPDPLRTAIASALRIGVDAFVILAYAFQLMGEETVLTSLHDASEVDGVVCLAPTHASSGGLLFLRPSPVATPSVDEPSASVAAAPTPMWEETLRVPMRGNRMVVFPAERRNASRVMSTSGTDVRWPGLVLSMAVRSPEEMPDGA